MRYQIYVCAVCWRGGGEGEGRYDIVAREGKEGIADMILYRCCMWCVCMCVRLVACNGSLGRRTVDSAVCGTGYVPWADRTSFCERRDVSE